ncbi:MULTISPECIES: InlB B-repeat-containing protein [unclassified Pseudoalteromonas]|uniref:InlB B-repeat-containing protein n=1 Tax=unclassified Pseudoalteromonas TaxID=194690 RepID=UPI0030158194
MKACLPKLLTITLCGFLSACGGSDTATEQAEPTTNYTITTDLVGSGTINPENIMVEAGATQTFKLTPAEGHTLEMVEGCNGSLDRGELEYTVENIQKNCTIVASFVANKLNIETQHPSGTKLTLDKSSYYYGDSLSATMVLGEGHVFESISGCNGELVDDVYAVNKLTESCEIVLKTQKIKETFSDENKEQPIQVAVLDNTGTIAATSQGIISTDHPSLPEMPEGIVLPFELLALDINTEVGGTALVEVTYPSPVSADATYLKSDGEQWYTMPEEQAQFSEDGTSVVLTLQDGGYGDSDGMANGIIKDPGGVAATKRIEVTTNTSGEGEITPRSQLVDYGATASFTLTPNEGFEITEVSGCEGTLAGNTYTTGSITSTCQVNASFSLQALTISANASEGGSISPSTQAVNYGETATFTLTPDEGYEISEAAGCNGTLSGNTYTTGIITSACQISASFSQQTFTVAASAGEGGGISPSTQTVTYGDTATFTLTPDEGYKITAATGCNGTLSGNTYTTGIITSACQIRASFSQQTFTVDASAGEGGGITPSTQTVTYGDNATFTLTPDEGYEISEVAGCNGTLSGSTYTTGAITSACQVNASFSQQSFSVDASAGEGGGISPSTQTVTYGDSATFTLTPDEGYEISEVAGCNGTLTGNTYTTGAITSACQVSASFSQRLVTVIAQSSSGGSVQPTSQSVVYGQSATFNITTLTGFNFLDAEGCEQGTFLNGEYVINSVTKSCSLTFEFVEKEKESKLTTNLENLAIDPYEEPVFIINGNDSKRLSSTTTNIDSSPEQQKLVSLVNEYGEPLLLGIKHAGEQEVNLSVESSAYTFIMTSQHLYGVQFQDTKTLFSRFKSHPDFTELVKELTTKINQGSPCPMDYSCSFMAAMIANKIAKDTQIDDLISLEAE